MSRHSRTHQLLGTSDGVEITSDADLPWANDDVLKDQANYTQSFSVQFNESMADSVRRMIGFLDIEDPDPATTQNP